MIKTHAALAGALLFALAGCGGPAESPQNAAATLENTVDNTTSDLAAVASNVPDSGEANAVVDEAGGLINTGEEAANTIANSPQKK